MKSSRGWSFAALLIAALLVTACKYDEPLVKKDSIEIDRSLLGRWTAVPQQTVDAEDATPPGDVDLQTEQQTEEPPATLLVLGFSDTEYLILYTEDDNSMYFRGYPITIGTTSCVQLEAIGKDDTAIDPGNSDRYMVMLYALTASGRLTVSMLNTDVVSDDLKDTESLVASFLEHEQDSDLFKPLYEFSRKK